MNQLLVDYSLIGHGRTFVLTLLAAERDRLEIGSRVQILGDGVPPRIAEVTAVSPDGRDFEFTCAEPNLEHGLQRGPVSSKRR